LARLVRVPTVAVGGITPEGAMQILTHGASGIAVINAIFKADDPERATRALADAIGK
jgi:thiamine monophosphate synthase